MKYFILREAIGNVITSGLRASYFDNNDVPEDLGLLDGDDKSNTIYTSTRSEGLSYMYNNSKEVMHFNAIICDMLSKATGFAFGDSINKIALPMCHYGDGGVILAHRGVKKDSDLHTYQGYVAVLMLTQRARDYNAGAFYLNDKAKCSADGKTVTNDKIGDRFYPYLNEGDIIVFDNTHYIHGVEETLVNNMQSGRLTCSFRTN